MMRTGVLYGGEAETFGFGRTECAAFTGYRPAKFLAAFPQGDARQRVGELLRPVVAGLYDLGVRLFLSGMAEGFDLWAAAEVLALRDRGRCPDAAVAAVIPFRGQERGYAPASLDEYRFICARAVAVRVLSDRYADAVMQLREADIAALVESGDLDQGAEPLTTQRMSELYPLFATSLLSLVKNAESAVTGSVPGDR